MTKDRFLKEDRSEYTDFATVESHRNDLAAEEFPDGPYGSPIPAHFSDKSSPWRKDQRSPNRFNYEDRQYHAGMDREYPGDQDAGDTALESLNNSSADEG